MHEDVVWFQCNLRYFLIPCYLVRLYMWNVKFSSESRLVPISQNRHVWPIHQLYVARIRKWKLRLYGKFARIVRGPLMMYILARKLSISIKKCSNRLAEGFGAEYPPIHTRIIIYFTILEHSPDGATRYTLRQTIRVVAVTSSPTGLFF